MHRIFRVKAYEAEHGPHFNEEHARKAVSKMENEDGTRGPHWSVEETTALASQYGINLGSRFNRYDWFVALNMVYSELSSCEVINAITSGNASLASQLASCCCNVRESISGVNNNITKMGYENQLSVCNQTNTLQNAITNGFNSLMADNASKFNIVGAKIDAQTQIINDKFCQLEMREMQNKIDALREDKQALQLSASQQAQTANIVNQIRPVPVPAYLTCNPYGCQGGLNDYGYGYGYGYNNGCGCGC